MLYECECDQAGVYSLVIAKKDADQGKRARSSYPLGDSFRCILKFSKAEQKAPSSSGGSGTSSSSSSSSSGAGKAKLLRSPSAAASLRDTWDDD
jgi:hypothetical protein